MKRQAWDGVKHRPIRYPKRHTDYYGLTIAEMAVLRAVCAGATSKEQIGAAICKSPHTVRTQLSDIYARLGVGSMSAAILFVLRDAGLRAVCFPQIKDWADESSG